MYCPDCSSDCEPRETTCASCGHVLDAQSDPLVGTVLPGGYVLQECIAGGGMGQIYRAEQSALGRSVAVKIVHPYLLHDDAVAKRFINEARLTSRLNHPNSVAVIDFGRTAAGILYLVMEHLRGRDLARVLGEDGLLSHQRTIDILRQLLDVLSEAHQLDIVHLDLKPENIILEPTRRGGDFVKVVDFGLARMLEGSRWGSGPAKTVAGTPDYMSPEQCRGDQPDSRSDLYSVGVVLFLMLTGRLPFEADTPMQVLLNHLSLRPPDPRQASGGRGIPDGLVEVLDRALEKDPDERFQSASEFSEALARARSEITGSLGLLSIPPDTPTKACHACGEFVPILQKFCGACGKRMPWAHGLPSLRPSGLMAKAAAVTFPFPLVGRTEEMGWLLALMNESAAEARACRVEGEIGVGRTRLLEALDTAASELGHPVYWMRAQPWPLAPPWSAVRELIPALVGQSQEQLAFDVPQTGGIAASGLSMLYRDADCSLPRAAAAAALKWALDIARQGSLSIVLLVDDFDIIDGASRNALLDALQTEDMARLCVVVAHAPYQLRPWMRELPMRSLRPLSQDQVAGLLGVSTLVEHVRQSGTQDVSPMFLEQLVRFDQEGGTNPPSRLGDLIAARLARLPADRRRVLQAVAVLGPDSTADQICALVSEVDVGAAARDLEAAGILSRSQSRFHLAHPLVRQIARATTPAAVLRELHRQVVGLGGSKLPVELRAYHMQQAGDAFGALLSLESVGERARNRDDLDTALEAFRRGFELARRSAPDADVDDAMHAVALFGRKLGETLAKMGQHSEAEGILRESIDFASTARQRARVTFALAKVARLRGNFQRAIDLASEAIDLAFDQDEELAASFEQEARTWKA